MQLLLNARCTNFILQISNIKKSNETFGCFSIIVKNLSIIPRAFMWIGIKRVWNEIKKKNCKIQVALEIETERPNWTNWLIDWQTDKKLNTGALTTRSCGAN